MAGNFLSKERVTLVSCFKTFGEKKTPVLSCRSTLPPVEEAMMPSAIVMKLELDEELDEDEEEEEWLDEDEEEWLEELEWLELDEELEEDELEELEWLELEDELEEEEEDE
jgi:hypothetical protein